MSFVTTREDGSHGCAEFPLPWTDELAECTLVFKYVHLLALYQERICYL